jgi:hypothetical protein
VQTFELTGAEPSELVGAHVTYLEATEMWTRDSEGGREAASRMLGGLTEEGPTGFLIPPEKHV